MLTRERESSRRLHSGFERNLPGYDRTPNVTATNRERVPPRRNRRNPLRATGYRDHAARPRCGVAVNVIRPSLSRKPVNLPECNSIRTALTSPQGRFCHPRWAEPEVVFRIVHIALDEGSPPTDGSPPPSYREQTVEIALGPNPIFQNGYVAALTRRVPPRQVVSAVPPSRRKRRPPRSPKRVGPPRIVETLRKAIEWRRQLDAGEVPNQAAIALREGITRARVTQVLGLLRLPTAVRSRILDMRGLPQGSGLSEHSLRQILRAAPGLKEHLDTIKTSLGGLAR